MSSLTLNQSNYQDLIKDWLQQECDGVKFPVPFDMGWKIAGYSKRSNAKRKLPQSSNGEFYSISEQKSGKRGRPKEVINLSCDGLKHLCLMADTEEGKTVRQYFIEAEKNWQLIQENHPQVAQDTELEKLKLQAEISNNQRKTTEVNERLFDKSQFVLTAHGPKMLALMMGQADAVVEKTEYRDRTVIVDENLSPITKFDGVGITYLAKRFGFGKGTKANKQCREWLKSIGITENDWVPEPTAHYTDKLPWDLVEKADHEWANGNGDRQKLIGE